MVVEYEAGVGKAARDEIQIVWEGGECVDFIRVSHRGFVSMYRSLDDALVCGQSEAFYLLVFR